MGDVNLEIKLSNLDENVSALATDFDNIKSDVVYYEQSGYLSKNLLNPTLETTTVNGVTCTNNGDGTYTLNGTASSSTFFYVKKVTYKANKKYRLSGCPVYNGDFANCLVGIKYDSNAGWDANHVEYGKGLTFSLDSDLTTSIAIVARNGYTYNNVVLKPMIVDADLYPDTTYDDFMPYAPSNIEIQGSKADNSVLSDVWNASTTYAVGQYCIYNNSLWKCLVQHSGQTPKEGTYWTKTSITSELIALWNAIKA